MGSGKIRMGQSRQAHISTSAYCSSGDNSLRSLPRAVDHSRVMLYNANECRSV